MKKLELFRAIIMSFIVLQASVVFADITIDNTDPGFELIGSGAWETLYNPPWPSFGNDILYNIAGNGEDQAIYTFEKETERMCWVNRKATDATLNTSTSVDLKIPGRIGRINELNRDRTLPLNTSFHRVLIDIQILYIGDNRH